MSNNQYKKEQARIFNKERREKLSRKNQDDFNKVITDKRRQRKGGLSKLALLTAMAGLTLS
jgi:hypothetical protein